MTNVVNFPIRRACVDDGESGDRVQVLQERIARAQARQAVQRARSPLRTLDELRAAEQLRDTL